MNVRKAFRERIRRAEKNAKGEALKIPTPFSSSLPIFRELCLFYDRRE
jgi:hypothetical protein